MTITQINELVSEAIADLDELNWVPRDELASVRTKLEDVQEALDSVEEKYGDECIDEGELDEDEL